jgi:hypothetical protein
MLSCPASVQNIRTRESRMDGGAYGFGTTSTKRSYLPSW